MGAIGGGFLRLFSTFVYFLAFACSAIILGFYSYFLAVLSDRDQFIAKQWKAVEGISGCAVLYTIAAVILTCCLGGISFFGFIAIVLNILFCGGMVAIAVLARQGAHSCGGYVNTPIGSGLAHDGSGFGSQGFGTGNGEETTYHVTYGTACRYNRAAFIVSIIGAFLFLCLAALQLGLVRHHKTDKRYGPSPANGYTSGRRRFWQRKRTNGGAFATRDAELARPSGDTAYTGSTVAGGNTLAKENGHHF